MKQATQVQFILAFIVLCNTFYYAHPKHDINLIGYLNNFDSLAWHTSSFVDTLPQDLKIKIFRTRPCPLEPLSEVHKKALINGVGLLDARRLKLQIEQGLRISGVSVYTDSWWYCNKWNNYKLIPNDSIKWAYCVGESTKIPLQWADKLNNNFDAVIVVDEWFIDVCRNSGVTIPIFTLPLVLNHLRPLLSRPVRKKSMNPFVFGCSGLFSPRKNQTLLIRAFHEEFRNDKNVQLIVHGKRGGSFSKIESLTRMLKNPRIKIFKKNLSRIEYENLIASFNCYALVSKGEGFSITPREALAAGVPCILSNNTGHKMLCKENVAYGVPSNIKEPAILFVTGPTKVPGEQFNCRITDVRKALREVYKNYQYYAAQGLKGRDWVRQYLPENLKSKYLNVVQPTHVILGPENKITHQYLMTNSKNLFNKYRALCSNQETTFEVLV